MGPEEFRAAGHLLIDWIADFRAGLEHRPVRSRLGPGEVGAAMPPCPAEGQGVDALLHHIEEVVVPGLTNLQHPANFAFFPANHSLSSTLGDLMSTGLGGLGISWESSPALTEVEQVVVEWLRDLCGLSDNWHGAINDTASTGALTSLICGRERSTVYGLAHGGLQSFERPLVVYTTVEAHSSVRKAALLAGFGGDHIRLVATDDGGRMRPEALAAAIRTDRAAGRLPCALVATLGTTGIVAFDPLTDLVSIAREAGLWVHVDAAMAGSAMLLPELRHLFDGVEQADVLVWNPHKWMGAALDCSMYYVRDPEHLVRVMSTNPSYLQSQTDGKVVQYRDWGLPLGRRFRALKLWFQLHLDGIEAIRARLRRDLANAEWLAGQVTAADEWTLVAPRTLQTVCLRHQPPGLDGAELDAHTLAWVAAINDSGEAYLTPAQYEGRWMVRVSIGAIPTEAQHVQRLWTLMQSTAGLVPKVG